MWPSIGFKDSPYNAEPLGFVKEDVELLIGREEEAVTLQTLLDSSRDGGVIVISGPPGVGKTSFLNTQQYLLWSDRAIFGPRLLPSIRACPLSAVDTLETLSLRLLHSLIVSIEPAIGDKSIPRETEKLRRWLRSPTAQGFEIGIQILGSGGNIGRSTTLPPIDSATPDHLRDAFCCAVAECNKELEIDGIMIALENVQIEDNAPLLKTLFAMRDTYFNVPGVWWVLVGQSGLAGLLQMGDPRLADSVSAPSIDLAPLTLAQLESAIERRVRRLALGANKRSPLTAEVHALLYSAGDKEIRFAFKYAEAVCVAFVRRIRIIALEEARRLGLEDESAVMEIAERSIASELIGEQIRDDMAMALLREIAEKEIREVRLTKAERVLLRRIQESGSVTPQDFKNYGCRSAREFGDVYLQPMCARSMLRRDDKGGARYVPRGIIGLALHLGVL